MNKDCGYFGYIDNVANCNYTGLCKQKECEAIQSNYENVEEEANRYITYYQEKLEALKRERG